jgi:hypothetical protein
MRPASRAPSRRGLADEQFLDALVLVAEALFQAQHALADDREAEVARLDDAGVDGADGNFVGALAADLDEVVVARRVGEAAGPRPRRGAADTSPAGQAPWRSQGRWSPPSLGDADHVARGPLHAVGGGEDAGEVGVTRGVSAGRSRLSQAWPWSMPNTQCRRKPCRCAALVAAPQRAEAAAGAVHGDGEGLQQILAARRMAAPDRRCRCPGLLVEFDGCRRRIDHVQLSMRAASWNQRVR